MRKVSIALVGVNGYGGFFLDKMLTQLDERNVEITGLITRSPEKCGKYQKCIDMGLKFYKNLDDFYANSFADLVIISTPINLHKSMTCLALSKGSNVLCEKPIAGSSDDAQIMLDAENKADGFVAIGYQWSFADAITSLKKDILGGVLGKPKILKTMVQWPRPYSYYTRNGWAGAIKTASGDIVLDSPVNNATAHYLHNMLFVLGETMNTAAEVGTLGGELYRVNDIENYDTAALKIKTTSDVDILFLTTHAAESSCGPVFTYEFENGKVCYDGTSAEIKAYMNDGSTKSYGDPQADADQKIWQCVEKIRGDRDLIYCGIETALPHLKCVEQIQDELSITQIDDYQIANEETDPQRHIKGINEIFAQSYSLADLPKNLGFKIA